ncbi:MAG: hypothetical protein M0P94_03470 [Candidatus Absconditabacterales bacterium]|nr:hypothetical protein [Candidatus Absconditabacterales bacterium]
MINNKNVLTTASSDKFFPFLLNLIGSIQKNYKEHPKIIVFDVGLNFFFKEHLKLIKNIEVIRVPKFLPFWDSCYSWKIWIYNNFYGDNHLHIDSGSSVLSNLDHIFGIIENKGYFTVSQKMELKTIVPKEYYGLLDFSNNFDHNHYFTAGILGINKKNLIINNLINITNDAMLSGLCLGFSESEQSRNKGKDKSPFIRNCALFRHDQTLLNIFFYKHIKNIDLENMEKYAYIGSNIPPKDCIIHNHRRNIDCLKYIKYINYKKKNLYFYISKVLVKIIILSYKVLGYIISLRK